MQNKEPRNEQDQPHGYWELYHENGNLHWKCFYKNGVPFGRRESYRDDGTFNYIMNYINGEIRGFLKTNYVKSYYAR